MSANVFEVKQKIMDYISSRGPSLPAHLTKVSEMNLTFTSAILSELLSDKKLKLSSLRVGSSPLYLIPGQEEKLESFISNLKEPEVEAFKRLKQNKILDDEKQDSVMRVALRSIRDFAIPLKHKEKLYWKYHLLSDEKATLAISESDEPVQAIGQDRVIGQQIWNDIQKQQISKEMVDELVRKQVEKMVTDIKEKNAEVPQEPIQEVKKPEFNDIEVERKKPIVRRKTKMLSKKDLFLKISNEYLLEIGFEVLEVLKSDANKVICKTKREKEFIVIFSNKKRIDEKELLKDLKKYNSFGLPVEVFISGEPSKKVLEKMDLLSKVQKIEKIKEQ